MVKVYIDSDEWYPCYFLQQPARPEPGDEFEISDDDFADYQRVMAEFEAWQDRLSAMAYPADDPDKVAKDKQTELNAFMAGFGYRPVLDCCPYDELYQLIKHDLDDDLENTWVKGRNLVTLVTDDDPHRVRLVNTETQWRGWSSFSDDIDLANAIMSFEQSSTVRPGCGKELPSK